MAKPRAEEHATDAKHGQIHVSQLMVRSDLPFALLKKKDVIVSLPTACDRKR